MPLRHTIYSKRNVAAVTPEKLLKHLEILDFWTRGEDYDISEEAVEVALPLRIKNIRPERFLLYHVSYVAFSPDGNTLASGSGGPEATIWLWPIASPSKEK